MKIQICWTVDLPSENDSQLQNKDRNYDSIFVSTAPFLSDSSKSWARWIHLNMDKHPHTLHSHSLTPVALWRLQFFLAAFAAVIWLQICAGKRWASSENRIYTCQYYKEKKKKQPQNKADKSPENNSQTFCLELQNSCNPKIGLQQLKIHFLDR